MLDFSGDVVRVVYQLLPGFLVAWIVYGLTAYRKPAPFERVVQALIFTMLVRTGVIAVRESALVVGSHWLRLGLWTEDSALVVSLIIALVFGVLIAWCVNHDVPCAQLRVTDSSTSPEKLRGLRGLLGRLRLTEKTLHPSEWYSAFSTSNSYVVLHLKGERRLFGWPAQYPDHPDEGHFLIENPEWLMGDGESAALHLVDTILLPAGDVEWVEFLKNPSDVTASDKEIEEVQKRLVAAQEKR